MLESCQRFAPGVPVIVADDGDEAASFDVCHEHEAMYVKLPFDVGLSAGRAALVERCQTDYIALFEDDFELTSDTQIQLMTRTARENNVDVLAAQLNPRSRFVGSFKKVGRTLHMRRGVINHRFGNIIFYDYVPNSAVCRVDAIKRVGFDKGLKLQEHWEFFWRAKAAGLAVGMDERFIINHRHDSSDLIYNKRRQRNFTQAGLRKHGLKAKVHK